MNKREIFKSSDETHDSLIQPSYNYASTCKTLNQPSNRPFCVPLRIFNSIFYGYSGVNKEMPQWMVHGKNFANVMDTAFYCVLLV